MSGFATLNNYRTLFPSICDLVPCAPYARLLKLLRGDLEDKAFRKFFLLI